ncbi:mannose-6P isomerase [Moumouvirus australiensis]|uniref:Mannose-6P isomerase n=1 Tax=Moumouvirus australiensis TaxID=2109587 RepID=A0A2P1EMC0_9VIRU|nr:mannose-6P isomerase [Moumouvirus australiensis]AVL95029.1 mannose-6P isomerase [Moumouvirus australiensis]
MTNTNIFTTDINKETINNNYYRNVLFTTKHQQLVIMSLKPREDIEFEIHPDNDQFIRIEKGQGVALIGKNHENKYPLKDDTCIIIPAGTYHQIINTSDTEYLKLYTIYSPPHHPPNKIDVTRPNESQKGGELSYNEKYQKYKQKYLSLKNKMNSQM